MVQWRYDPLTGNVTYTCPPATVAVLTDIDVSLATGFADNWTVTVDIDGLVFLVMSGGELGKPWQQWHGRRVLQPAQVLQFVGIVADASLVICAGGYLYT